MILYIGDKQFRCSVFTFVQYSIFDLRRESFNWLQAKMTTPPAVLVVNADIVYI